MSVKVLIYMICILVIGLLQSMILEYFEVFDIKPNLFIVFIISVSLTRKKVEALTIGFFIGFIQDIISGKFFRETFPEDIM